MTCLHRILRPMTYSILRGFHFGSVSLNIRVCVVGSGPAGFYAAHKLLKMNKSIHVDIYERLPVPFGLVRFGVAPDHPEVKNVINSFTETAQNERCKLFGNVDVGRDVTIKELLRAYTAVILSYGAEEDKTLGIPGEDVGNVLSAREIVGWYNGNPQNRNLDINLSSSTATILGHGNVALDVARILLSPTTSLKDTDITNYALNALERSRVKHVYIVGRRGPLQVAFTIKELREMTKIPGCSAIIDPMDLSSYLTQIKDLPRPRKRITQLMVDTSSQFSPSLTFDSEERKWTLKFLRSPLEIMSSSGLVAGVKFSINELKYRDGREVAVKTTKTEEISCGLVIKSIGYKGVNIDDSLPFDSSTGTLRSSNGRVDGLKGVYCTGWIRRGPEGVIASTMNDAFEVANQVLSDIDSGLLNSANRRTLVIGQLLKDRGVKVVDFTGWTKIDKREMHNGHLSGKSREKLTDIDEMLTVALS